MCSESVSTTREHLFSADVLDKSGKRRRRRSLDLKRPYCWRSDEERPSTSSGPNIGNYTNTKVFKFLTSFSNCLNIRLEQVKDIDIFRRWWLFSTIWRNSLLLILFLTQNGNIKVKLWQSRTHCFDIGLHHTERRHFYWILRTLLSYAVFLPALVLHGS